MIENLGRRKKIARLKKNEKNFILSRFTLDVDAGVVVVVIVVVVVVVVVTVVAVMVVVVVHVVVNDVKAFDAIERHIPSLAAAF